MNRAGVGSTKIWLKGKKHSYVRISDVGGDRFTITFQNDKFKTREIILDAEEFVIRAKLRSFMNG